MNNRLCLFVLIAAFLMLSGCGGESAPHTDSSRTDVEEILLPDMTTETVQIEYWQLYAGDVNLADVADTLPVVHMESRDGILYVFDTEYVPLDMPAEKFELPTASGWRIDLGELSVIGTTTSGEIILMPDCKNSPLICIYDRAIGQPKCYLREDVGTISPDLFDLVKFESAHDGFQSQKSIPAENIWKLHTSVDAYEQAFPLLDGDWTYYSLTLVSKECPALQYEIKCGICEDILYIENIHTEYMICVPADQVINIG